MTNKSTTTGRLGLYHAAFMARSVLKNLPPAELSERVAVEELTAALENLDLHSQIHSIEAAVIGEAMRKCDGHPTAAARLLGVPHQGLLYMLNTRHKEIPRSQKKARRKNLGFDNQSKGIAKRK